MSDKKKVQSKKAVFPLNSRRLKLYQLPQLAQALELPIKAPSNDLRVMVEEKLTAMDRDPVNTQVVVHLQEEGTENLSLQDEESQFLHVIPQFLLLMVMRLHGVLKTKEAELQQLLEAGSEPVQEGPMASTASDKPLTGGFQGEAKEEELQQPLMVVSELVQESPVTSIAGDEALTELEAKYAELQEQLHYTKEENSLLNQNLEEKEQKLSVLKDIMDQDKALLEEVC